MHAQFNRFELENFAKVAAQAYLDNGVDLNDSITDIAREHSFTDHQVERVSENANILVNGSLVTQARSKGSDPRVTFDMAKSAEVKGRLHDDGGQDLRKTAEVLSLFTIPSPGPENVIDRVLGKMAADPYSKHPKSVDHVQMTRGFIVDQSETEKLAASVDARSLSLVCQTLEDMEHHALSDHTVAKLAMSESESEMRSEINDQLLYGMTPATMRDVIKHAQLDANVAGYVDELVTKVASGLRLREGKSAFATGSLTNVRHPLIVKSAAVMDKVGEAVAKRQGLSKLSAAHQSARVQYAQAVRENRS